MKISSYVLLLAYATIGFTIPLGLDLFTLGEYSRDVGIILSTMIVIALVMNFIVIVLERRLEFKR